MACRILFIRHGQSLGNLNGVFLGETDLDLSPLGYKQAECVASYLKCFKIDAIYSSDLKRAYNTSLPTSKYFNIKVLKSDQLREIKAGDWENKSFDSLQNDYADSYGIWLSDIGNSRAKNGESVAELQKRIVSAVLNIAKENDTKTVAIFTHATPIRAFYCYVDGQSLDDMKDIPWASNASVSEVLFDNGKFSSISYSLDHFMDDLKSKLPKNC